MIRASTIQLLRFHFSFFLMPVYWFALSQTKEVSTSDSIVVFLILHLLLYPASNGYNSYMDRDTGSIGGIKNPKLPTKQLFYVSLIMDCLAVLTGLLISLYFVLGTIAFIAASRAYSYRGIRLKKYAIGGYLTVIIFQGALVFFLVMHGCSSQKLLQVPLIGMVAASLLVGGFYPLTQIYQHMQDKEDGVFTLSYKLGYTGTFVFTMMIYALSMTTLGIYLGQNAEFNNFLIMQIFLFPVLVYFFWWFYRVYHNNTAANFVNTMQMNILASVCTNAAFIFLCITKQL